MSKTNRSTPTKAQEDDLTRKFVEGIRALRLPGELPKVSKAQRLRFNKAAAALLQRGLPSIIKVRAYEWGLDLKTARFGVVYVEHCWKAGFGSMWGTREGEGRGYAGNAAWLAFAKRVRKRLEVYNLQHRNALLAKGILMANGDYSRMYLKRDKAWQDAEQYPDQWGFTATGQLGYHGHFAIALSMAQIMEIRAE